MGFLPPLGTTYSSVAAFKLDALERAGKLGHCFKELEDSLTRQSHIYQSSLCRNKLDSFLLYPKSQVCTRMSRPCSLEEVRLQSRYQK